VCEEIRTSYVDGKNVNWCIHYGKIIQQFLKIKPSSYHISQAWWYTPLISATWEVEVGRFKLEAILGKISRPYSKQQQKIK
jgi:hypothetical protein